MARIRTIKPEFWRDDDLSSISPEAALLAIGILNHADDDGYFNANPKLVESDVFPLRELSSNITALMDELARIGYLKLFEGVDGKVYGLVVNFARHQVINKPSASKIKELCKKSEEYGIATVALPIGKERKGKQRKGKERKDSLSEQSPDTPKRKHHGSEEDHRTARWMYERVHKVDATAKEPNWDSWANDIRLMREIDGRDHKAICDLFAWANQDAFWCSNVMCPSKLRDKWTQLTAQLTRRGVPHKPRMSAIGVDAETPEGFSDGFR